jgi:hypothetical protein
MQAAPPEKKALLVAGAHFWFALAQQRRDRKYWLPGTHAVSWRNVPCDDPAVRASVGAFALRQLARRARPRRG